jgi:hypothetical protein
MPDVTPPIACDGHGIGVLHVTGGNYSKGHREPSVAGLVDGNLVASHDPAGSAARELMHVAGSLGGMLDNRGQSDELGAARIMAHPILGDLPPSPLVEFTFDGSAVQGREGEPIAAALFAAGYRVLRTMPRFGDVRGGYCMIGRCADCMVVVDDVPNVPACLTPVSAGLVVRTQRGLGESASEAGERGQ